MRLMLGKILFKVFRKVLSLFGYKISLGSAPVSFPELSPEELAFITKVYSESLTMTSFECLTTLAIACKYIQDSGINGDFVEAGVWRGGSSIVAKRMLKNRRFFLYDTYQGMTKPSDFDFRVGSGDASTTKAKWTENQKQSHNEWVFAPIGEVKDNFSRFNLLDNSVIFVQGAVETTLREEGVPSEIALLRLDTDFYESTLIELEILWPQLTAGGILILDDYGHWDGARKAVDEYFSNQGIKPLMIPIAGGGGRLVQKITLNG